MQKIAKPIEQRINDIFQSLDAQFLCPITQMPMQNPFMTEDGHSYEQGAIYKWLITSKKSPKTGLQLLKTTLTPNHCLKQLIHKLQTFKTDILQQVYKTIVNLVQFIDLQAKESTRKLTQIKIKLESVQKIENQKDNPILKDISKRLSCYLSEEEKDKEKSIGKVKEQFPLLAEQIQLKQDFSHQKYELEGKTVHKGRKQSKMSSAQQNEEIFTKWLKSLNSAYHSHTSYTQNHLLQPYEYLLQKFNSETEQIADRYRKDRYTHELGLWHNSVPIESMNLFVKYDWNVIQFINVCKCQINDEAWTLLVKHAQIVFSQLKTIWIYGNQITTVTEKEVQAFSRLKQIEFSHYNGLTNPFTSKTKQNLKKFKAKSQNKHIYLQFTE